MKIYSPSNNHKLEKIIFAAKIYQIQLDHIEVPFSHKNKQFQDAYPGSTLPALQLSDGSFIFGTNSILISLVPETLFGSAFSQAEINQWLQISEKEVQSAVGVYILKKNNIAEISEEQLSRAKQSIIKTSKLIDERLKIRTFLVGDRLSVADISLYFSLLSVQSDLADEFKKLTNFGRWAKHINSIRGV